MQGRIGRLIPTIALAAVMVGAAALPTLSARPAGAGGWLSSFWAGQHSYAANEAKYSSPTVADLNGDGSDEVIVGNHEGDVLIRDVRNNLTFSLPVEVVPGQRTAVDASPTVADLDNNGTKEIIAGAGSLSRVREQGGVVVFNANGSRRCSFQTNDNFHTWDALPGNGPDGYSEPVVSTPAVGDVDGDGFPDIVFGALDFRTYAIDRNCNLLAGFIRSDYDFDLNRWSVNYNDDTVWSSPALFDVDNDGRYEIFQGADSTAGALIDINGGVFRMLDLQNGRLEERWRRYSQEVFTSSPGIADINGDGRLEVVVGTGYYWRLRNPGNPDTSKLWAFDAATGNDVPGWPVNLGGPYVWNGVAIGDVTGDGRADVVVGTANYQNNGGDVRAYRGDGSPIWIREPNQPGEGGGPIYGSPIVADLDSDGVNDVAVLNGWGLFTMRGTNGTRLYPPYAADTGGQNAPFVMKSQRQWYLGAAFANGVLKGLAIPTPRARAWPMFGQTPEHRRAPAKTVVPRGPEFCGPDVNPRATPNPAVATGYWVLAADGGVANVGQAPWLGSMGGQPLNAPIGNIVPTASSRGYWLLGRDGGVFSFGDAQFFGSTGSMVLNAPIIGMAATPDGGGYWLLGADGGVFTFGSAQFFGSTGGMRLNAPVISMTPTASGRGYWLLASDGGVFTFGDATFHGSTGSLQLAAPVRSMAADPRGRGYWLVASDGGVFSFDVPFFGSLPGTGLCAAPPSMQIRPTATGGGYYVLAQNGRVFPFGDAPNLPTIAVWDAQDLALKR